MEDCLLLAVGKLFAPLPAFPILAPRVSLPRFATSAYSLRAACLPISFFCERSCCFFSQQRHPSLSSLVALSVPLRPRRPLALLFVSGCVLTVRLLQQSSCACDAVYDDDDDDYGGGSGAVR